MESYVIHAGNVMVRICALLLSLFQAGITICYVDGSKIVVVWDIGG
jgi:hypothetical protein